MGQNLRRTPIYRALYRPQQLLGAERELMMLALCISFGTVLTALTIVAAILSALIYVFLAFALRKMYLADPIMSQIYRRQIKYQNYYAPFSRPSRTATQPHPY